MLPAVDSNYVILIDITCMCTIKVHLMQGILKTSNFNARILKMLSTEDSNTIILMHEILKMLSAVDSNHVILILEMFKMLPAVDSNHVIFIP